MYSRSQLLKKYLHYYLTASNGRGHGIHFSPFVFNLITQVLRDKKKYDCFHKIESRRKELLADDRQIDVEDLGAGSSIIRTTKRNLSDIAASSLKPAKYAQLLFRMVNYFRPASIIELGTSFGITTAYLSSGNTDAKVYTCEGAAAISGIARQTFDSLGLKNIELKEGDFSNTLVPLLQKTGMVQFAFIDGNHRMAPTLEYFRQLAEKACPSTILVFDDIHWSKEMEAAWSNIQQDPSVTLSIDLFFIGIVFFNTDINHKQQFTIRF